jgi:hypothetical protein
MNISNTVINPGDSPLITPPDKLASIGGTNAENVLRQKYISTPRFRQDQMVIIESVFAGGGGNNL